MPRPPKRVSASISVEQVNRHFLPLGPDTPMSKEPVGHKRHEAIPETAFVDGQFSRWLSVAKPCLLREARVSSKRASESPGVFISRPSIIPSPRCYYRYAYEIVKMEIRRAEHEHLPTLPRCDILHCNHLVRWSEGHPEVVPLP